MTLTNKQIQKRMHTSEYVYKIKLTLNSIFSFPYTKVSPRKGETFEEFHFMIMN